MTTNASGHFVVLLAVTTTPGDVLTATATDLDGNTSEFSYCARIVGGPAMGSTELAGVTNAPTIIKLPASPETPLNTPIIFAGGKAGPINSTGTGLLTVSDPNPFFGVADIRQYEVVVSVTHGTLELKRNPAATSVAATGTLAAINSVLATLVYSPEQDFAGADTLHLQVSDPGTSKDHETAVSVSELLIHVGPFNHPPVITLPAPPEYVNGKLVTSTTGSIGSSPSGPFAGISITDADVSSSAASVASGTTGKYKLYEMILTVGMGALTSGTLNGGSP